MAHDLVLRNCEPEIGITDGRIAEIDPAGSGRDTLDAAGLQLLPGVIDAHVHFNEPGRTDWEGFETGSRAAAAGGVTTVFDMPLNSHPPLLTAVDFEVKRRCAEAASLVDFALWGGLTPLNVDRVEELAAAGVIGFKAFMSPSGIGEFPHSAATTLRAGMQRIAATGLRMALHAEDPTLCTPGSRPPAAEVSAIRLAADLAGETGCPLTIVHVSCVEALDAVLAARATGVDITCETCPHYLVLNEQDAADPVARCAPPLRPEASRRALVERLDEIDTIGSDHSPCLSSMKTGERPWGGISGIQHLLPLAGADRSDQLAHNPARIFRLPGKGRIELGADADLVLFDPAAETVVRTENLYYRNPHSPYVGRRIRGRVIRTLLRGRTVFHERPLGPPRGRLLKPELSS